MKIEFEFVTEFGVYRDAIIFPDDHTYTNEQIEEMKRKRVNGWLDMLRNPPVEQQSEGE